MRNDKHKRPTGNYEVGYKRPPRAYRFKKGSPSPNPKGRPRGSRRLNLADVLLELVPIKVQGRLRKVPYLEAYLQVMKERAIKGDNKAGQMLLFIAQQMKMIKTIDEPLDEEDYEFTMSLGPRPSTLKKCKTKVESWKGPSIAPSFIAIRHYRQRWFRKMGEPTPDYQTPSGNVPFFRTSKYELQDIVRCQLD